jgi:hypothetical protein
MVTKGKGEADGGQAALTAQRVTVPVAPERVAAVLHSWIDGTLPHLPCEHAAAEPLGRRTYTPRYAESL